MERLSSENAVAEVDLLLLKNAIGDRNADINFTAEAPRMRLRRRMSDTSLVHSLPAYHAAPCKTACEQVDDDPRAAVGGRGNNALMEIGFARHYKGRLM